MTGVITANPLYQFSDSLGAPLVAGTLTTYLAGTTTPTPTWQDSGLTVANTNPIVLNSRGECTLWLDSAVNYKFLLKDSSGTTQWTVDNIRGGDSYAYNQAALLAASGGSNLVGFLQAGTGAVTRTMQSKMRESVSVTDFGAASGASAAQNVIGFQAALDYANSLGGATVSVPADTFTLNSAIRIYASTTLEGSGWEATQLTFTHTGDGINSTWPINSSTVANVNVKNMSIVNTNGANLGGGFVDVGGTYVNVENCLFTGWKYGVIFDQSELAIIDRNNFSGMTTAQIWLVNGPDHTVGALKGFTNRIVISNNQLNGAAATVLILDDGGGNHLISGNNFNSGATQLLACYAAGLTVINNEFEGTNSYPIYFRETTTGGVRLGGPQGFSINSNTISANSVGGACIYIDEAYCGDITSNFFYYATSSALQYNYGTNYRISGISVSGNIVSNVGAARTATPMVLAGQLDIWKRQGNFKQGMQTYCTSAFGTGAVQITPASMVGIYDGAILRIVNADGTNPETCAAYINLAAPTTFFVTLTSTKAANFLIFVEDGDYSGQYTPQVTGSGPVGGATQSAQYGSFTKVGNRCIFQVGVTWTALTGGAAGQLKLSLPMRPKVDSLATTVIHCVLIGAGAIGLGAVCLSPSSSESAATLLTVNSGTGAFGGVNIPAAGSLYVSGSYEI